MFEIYSFLKHFITLKLDSVFQIVIGLGLLLAACGGEIPHDDSLPDASIEVDGEEIASLRGDRTTSVLNFTTDLENPTITGKIRLEELTFTEDPSSGDVSACYPRRFTFNANDGLFLNDTPYSPQNSAFVSIIEQSSFTRDRDRIYSYSTPPLALPNDGTTVRLELGSLFGYVTLADDVIVMPVHVHVFRRRGATLDMSLNERNVRSWFDSPNIRTSAVTTLDRISGKHIACLITEDINTIGELYVPVDSIWNQAKIQFRLASYEIVENDELERQIVSGRRNEFVPAAVHAGDLAVNGIHIYIGRNATNVGLIAGQTQGPHCFISTDRYYAIALAWDQARGTPTSLAHELGHYLGLEHIDETTHRECAAGLLDSSDEVSANLMTSHPSRTARLSFRQINRAREMACRYLALWDIGSTGCIAR